MLFHEIVFAWTASPSSSKSNTYVLVTRAMIIDGSPFWIVYVAEMDTKSNSG